MAISAFATTGANQVYYALARRHGKPLAEKQANPMVEKVRSGVERHGSLLLLLSRFMFGFRIAIPAACGVVGMPGGRFFWVNSAGAIIWVLALGYAGYFGSDLIHLVLSDVRQHELLIAIAVAVFVAAFALWRSRGRDLDETRIAFEHPEQLPEHAFGAISKAASHAGLVSALLADRTLPKE